MMATRLECDEAWCVILSWLTTDECGMHGTWYMSGLMVDDWWCVWLWDSNKPKIWLSTKNSEIFGKILKLILKVFLHKKKHHKITNHKSQIFVICDLWFCDQKNHKITNHKITNHKITITNFVIEITNFVIEITFFFWFLGLTTTC